MQTRDLEREIKEMDCAELDDIAEFISMSFLGQSEQRKFYKFIETRRNELESVSFFVEHGEYKAEEF